MAKLFRVVDFEITAITHYDSLNLKKYCKKIFVVKDYSLNTLEKIFLETVAKKGYTLFLEHDYYQSCCTLKETDKGIRLNKSFQFEDKF